jgi:hypothetical protein
MTDIGTVYLTCTAARRLRQMQRRERRIQLLALGVCGLVVAAPWLALLAWMEWPR